MKLVFFFLLVASFLFLPLCIRLVVERRSRLHYRLSFQRLLQKRRSPNSIQALRRLSRRPKRLPLKLLLRMVWLPLLLILIAVLLPGSASASCVESPPDFKYCPDKLPPVPDVELLCGDGCFLMHPDDMDNVLKWKRLAGAVPELRLSINKLVESVEEVRVQRDAFAGKAEALEVRDVYITRELQELKAREKTAWLRHAWWLVPGGLTGLIIGLLI